MQDHYNLLYREEEREMLPLCADAKIGVLPWSPLARGRLTRPWDTETARTKTDVFGKTLYKSDTEAERSIVEAVAAVAAERGVPAAQIALAWIMQKPLVTAPIVGASKSQHLADAVAALSMTLTDAEIARLETPYRPHAISGHS
jgi:aryl-alcohol dehydrogenase-like predicted oxidoreductase